MIEHDELIGEIPVLHVRKFVKLALTASTMCGASREVISPDLLQARNEMVSTMLGIGPSSWTSKLW